MQASLKTYVAALVLQLVDEGILSLEDTVADWLPAMMYINPGIKISHMLYHQSGVYNFTNHPDLTPSALADLNKHWTPEELLSSFLGQTLYSPGTSSGYSNTNFILLGMIIKAATGEDISTLFRSRFFVPNNLTATYLGSEEEGTGEVVTTWTDWDSDGVLEDNTVFFKAASVQSLRWAAGGMISTPEEVARWAKILFKGDLLTPATHEKMLNFLQINGTGSTWTGYGLGIQEYNISGTTFWGHSGWIRGAVSLMVYSPVYDISIAVASNDERARHFSIVPALFEAAREFLVPTNTDSPQPSTSLLSIDTFPNPFHNHVTLSYQLNEPSSVKIIIYDILGRQVSKNTQLMQGAGTHNYVWSGRTESGAAVPPGVYLYTLMANGTSTSGHIIRR